MAAMLARTWPAAAVFAVGMFLASRYTHGVQEGFLTGALALVVVPFVWWHRVANERAITIVRGGVIGGLLGGAIQGGASLVLMISFALRTGISSRGWSPVGWAFALVIAAASVVFGAIVGTACGVILVARQQRAMRRAIQPDGEIH
ncbi:MAG: hypothetical protein HZA61_09415 [Candidatus Eisenbacteria bacterium]|uniref:Uncharacterized protein n=1 Tax=Eiseniibacteriota bacterium TaxID=2212470 RepID=A0A933WAW1_UNCEI|nr:hypothetical protein [Candidatus Eisenbacteria bacterium]